MRVITCREIVEVKKVIFDNNSITVDGWKVQTNNSTKKLIDQLLTVGFADLSDFPKSYKSN